MNGGMTNASGLTSSAMPMGALSPASPEAVTPVSTGSAGGAEALPEILLEPLCVPDHVRARWESVQGLSSPVAQGGSGTTDGYVRLMGLLSDGSPWESRVSMDALAQPGGVVIGRDDSCCQIVLPEASVSRQHVRLELISSEVVITDMASTNGASVNGKRLREDERRVALRDGFIVSLGEIPLLVEVVQCSGSKLSEVAWHTNKPF